MLWLQNELAILEFIHCLVETLDRYFSNVCELDLMFNLEMVSSYACSAIKDFMIFKKHSDTQVPASPACDVCRLTSLLMRC